MNDKAMKYLHTVDNVAQYPGARVEMAGYGNNFIYKHSASSAVESMNSANRSARARTAVDVVCATKLLLSMSSKRYHDKKEMTWKWQEELTPHGEKLFDEAFDNINYPDYSINITDCESKWECRVMRRSI